MLFNLFDFIRGSVPFISSDTYTTTVSVFLLLYFLMNNNTSHFFLLLCLPLSFILYHFFTLTLSSPSLRLPLSCYYRSPPPLPLLPGLSKSFPLDNSLFDSWLAQSVQITADDMLSQWALGAQHRDKSGSLLSDQVRLQQQEVMITNISSRCHNRLTSVGNFSLIQYF